jgi:hypothetical protein
LTKKLTALEHKPRYFSLKKNILLLYRFLISFIGLLTYNVLKNNLNTIESNCDCKVQIKRNYTNLKSLAGCQSLTFMERKQIFNEITKHPYGLKQSFCSTKNELLIKATQVGKNIKPIHLIECQKQ